MREIRPLRIGENVYWISAAAAARCARNKGKGAMVRRRRLLPNACVDCGATLFMQTRAMALDVALELEELVQARFLHALGLALAGGILSASMLSLM